MSSQSLVKNSDQWEMMMHTRKWKNHKNNAPSGQRDKQEYGLKKEQKQTQTNDAKNKAENKIVAFNDILFHYENTATLVLLYYIHFSGVAFFSSNVT